MLRGASRGHVLTPDALLALIGLLVVVEGTGLLVLGLLLYQHTERVRHLSRVVLTLTQEHEATQGTRIAVDRGLLLGEPEDVVAADGEDLWSKVPDPRPWRVVEDEAPER